MKENRQACPVHVSVHAPGDEHGVVWTHTLLLKHLPEERKVFVFKLDVSEISELDKLKCLSHD
jgi:hypothetical protein